MVIPVGERYQQTLYLLKKTDGKMVSEALQPTLFVPMTGKAEASREVLPDPANPTITNGGFERRRGRSARGRSAGTISGNSRWSRPRRPRRQALRHVQQLDAGPRQPRPARLRRRRAEGAAVGALRAGPRQGRPPRPERSSNCPASSSASTTRTGPPSARSRWARGEGTFDWQTKPADRRPAEGPRGHPPHRPAGRGGRNLVRRIGLKAGEEG